MPETLGDRLPAALKRIGHFLGSDQVQKVKGEFVADVMAIFAAVTDQVAEIERLELENRELREALEISLAVMQANIAYATRKDEPALKLGIEAARAAIAKAKQETDQ
jgi:regulator of replication initiation timing